MGKKKPQSKPSKNKLSKPKTVAEMEKEKTTRGVPTRDVDLHGATLVLEQLSAGAVETLDNCGRPKVVPDGTVVMTFRAYPQGRELPKGTVEKFEYLRPEA